MTKEFIQLGKHRVRKSCIKKYFPEGTEQINIYYSPSRLHSDFEIVHFGTIRRRNFALKTLDKCFM